MQIFPPVPWKEGAKRKLGRRNSKTAVFRSLIFARHVFRTFGGKASVIIQRLLYFPTWPRMTLRCYFSVQICLLCLFHYILARYRRQLWKWVKIPPYSQRQKCSPRTENSADAKIVRIFARRRQLTVEWSQTAIFQCLQSPYLQNF